MLSLQDRPSVSVFDPSAYASAAPELGETNLILICPSLGKSCGVARYSSYVAEACEPNLASVRLVADCFEAYRAAVASEGPCIALLQHEYGLLDHNGPLAGPETTASAIKQLSRIQALREDCRVGVVMHSLALHDHVLNAYNRQWFSAGFPLFCLSRDGAQAANVNFLEHGVRLRDDVGPPEEPFSIGAFGLLSDSKDIDSLLQLCARTETPIRANFASSDPARREQVLRRAAALGVEGEISFAFLQEGELARFLRQASVLYMPQHDIEHYATSGSARFALSLGRPVIVPPHRPFHDLAGAVHFADLQGAVAEVRRLKQNPSREARFVEAGQRFVEQADLDRIYSELIDKLSTDKVWTGGAQEGSPRIVELTPEALSARIESAAPELTAQELGCFRETGVGTLRGEFLIGALPRGAGRGKGAGGVSRAVRRAISARAPNPRIVQEEIEARQLGLEQALRSGEEERFTLAMRADPRARAALLRSFRATGTLLSATYLLNLPLVCQLMLLEAEFGVSLKAALDYAAGAWSCPSTVAMTPGRLQALKRLAAHHPRLSRQLVWAGAPLPNLPVRKRLVFPAELLLFDGEMFVLALYRLLLQRDPEPEGFTGYLRELELGASKAALAHDVCRGAEARALGVEAFSDESLWDDLEGPLQRDLCLCAGLATDAQTLQASNLAVIAANANAGLLRSLRC